MISLTPFENRFHSPFDNFLDVSPLQSALNVNTQEDRYVVMLEVPGMTKEDLSIESREGLLTIKGTKDIHGYKKTVNQRLSIPKGIDLEQATAAVEHGILMITLPKSIAQATRTIAIR